jgi:hypothetical protein
MGELGGISQRGIDVFRPQGRIATENVLSRGTLREAVKDHCDGNPGTRDTNVPTADQRVAR